MNYLDTICPFLLEEYDVTVDQDQLKKNVRGFLKKLADLNLILDGE